jgi:hypothetical protein
LYVLSEKTVDVIGFFLGCFNRIECTIFLEKLPFLRTKILVFCSNTSFDFLYSEIHQDIPGYSNSIQDSELAKGKVGICKYWNISVVSVVFIENFQQNQQYDTLLPIIPCRHNLKAGIAYSFLIERKKNRGTEM